MNLIYNVAFACMFFVTLASACSPVVNTGFIPATNLKRLGIKEKNIDRIDSLLGTALVNQWAAEATAFVAQNGHVVYNKSFGFRDRETKALSRDIDVFRLGELSQPIVSLAALVLVEKGKLNLDDKVANYLPEFIKPQVIKTFNALDTSYTAELAVADISIRQLLNHTSGIVGSNNYTFSMLYDKDNIPFFATTKDFKLGAKMKTLASLPLAYQPGKQFSKGLSTDVLGAVIERVTGLTLDSVLNQTVLNPLGMTNTSFFLPLSKASRLSTMYSELPNGRLQRCPLVLDKINLNYPVLGAKSYLSGSSGLVSTVSDYANFLQMILNKGVFNKKQIATAQTIALLTENQIGSLTVEGQKYSFGFDLAIDANVAIGAKPGKISCKGIFNTYCWLDSQRGTVALLFTQVYPSIHGQILKNEFERIVNNIFDDNIK